MVQWTALYFNSIDGTGTVRAVKPVLYRQEGGGLRSSKKGMEGVERLRLCKKRRGSSSEAYRESAGP